jgi:hypothetical protein
MDDAEKIRIGGNEIAFRGLNEKLRAGTLVADAERLFPFRCECGVLGCNQLIELTIPEYEAVRASPVQFFLVDGHEITETEHVIARHPRYTVVEKEEPSAGVARDADPRS